VAGDEVLGILNYWLVLKRVVWEDNLENNFCLF